MVITPQNLRLGLQSVGKLEVELDKEHRELIESIQVVESERLTLKQFEQALVALDNYIMHGRNLLASSPSQADLQQFYEKEDRAFKVLDAYIKGYLKRVEEKHHALFKIVRQLMVQALQVKQEIEGLIGQERRAAY